LLYNSRLNWNLACSFSSCIACFSGVTMGPSMKLR
jgi:hypothetical protein